MLTCTRCGCCDETVQETYDPYDRDVYGDWTPVTWCTDCVYERALEI